MKMLLVLMFFIYAHGFSETLYFDFDNDDHLNWALCKDIYADWVHAKKPAIDGEPVDIKKSIIGQQSSIWPRFNIYLQPSEPLEVWKHYDHQLKLLNGAFRLSSRPENLHAFLKNLRDNGISCRIIFNSKDHESSHIVFQAGPMYVFDPPSISEALRMMNNPIGDRFYNRLTKMEQDKLKPILLEE